MYILADVSSICSALEGNGIVNLTSTAYTIVKVVVPLLLIVWGMLDFGQAVIAGKEDEIKAKQKLFIRRIIAAIMVFLVLAIVDLVIGVVTPTDSESIMGCVKTILGA